MCCVSLTHYSSLVQPFRQSRRERCSSQSVAMHKLLQFGGCAYDLLVGRFHGLVSTSDHGGSGWSLSLDCWRCRRARWTSRSLWWSRRAFRPRVEGCSLSARRSLGAMVGWSSRSLITLAIAAVIPNGPPRYRVPRDDEGVNRDYSHVADPNHQQIHHTRLVGQYRQNSFIVTVCRRYGTELE